MNKSSGEITPIDAFRNQGELYFHQVFATVKQLEAAKGLYEILFNRLREYLNNSAKKLDSF